MKQRKQIDNTIGSSRFIYNQILRERINVYDELKEDRDKLYNYRYKTEKEYKKEFPWLKEVSSRALQQSRGDLNNAFRNFFNNIKKGKKLGFPKFKSKHKSKWSYREPQVKNQIRFQDNKLFVLKLRLIKYKGLSKGFSGAIKNVTITKTRSDKYFASLLVEKEYQDVKIRTGNQIQGLDLGLKSFIMSSNRTQYQGIMKEILKIEKTSKRQQKHLSRKVKDSNRRNKCRIKLAKAYEYKTNKQRYYLWNLANQLCRESQAIVIENLNVSGMKRNRKLSHSIHLSNWSMFTNMLEQKAKEYGTHIYQVSTFYPSSKTCSACGEIKKELSLSDRQYNCSCGLSIDRDLNASLNLRNKYLKDFNISAEFVDNSRGEDIRLMKFNFMSSLFEAITLNS
jgi:putative transposase